MEPRATKVWSRGVLLWAGALFASASRRSPVQPAFAADKVSLFKVITIRDEIIIGIAADELAKMDGNAGGIERTLVAKGWLTAWQYAVRARPPMAALRRRSLHKVGRFANEALRIEPFATQLKVLPIDDSQK